jgi:hypothetical protein
MKRDVFMSVGSAIPPCFGGYPDSASLLYPLLDGQHEIVASRLISNCTEFGIIKTGIIQGFPFPRYSIVLLKLSHVMIMCSSILLWAMSVSEI